MSSSDYRVAIVADPEFGERLMSLAERMHVWVPETPANRKVAEQIWRADVLSIERGATTFCVRPSASADEWVAGILADVELHHGQYSHNPPVSTLEIYGAELSPRLRDALASIGFTHIETDGACIVASLPRVV